MDSSGDTTTVPQGRTFTYDAENKQVLVTDTNGTIGEYFYDGDGRRVLKHVPSTGETTAPKVAYLTNEHLGSPRINTDANGTGLEAFPPVTREQAVAVLAVNLKQRLQNPLL